MKVLIDDRNPITKELIGRYAVEAKLIEDRGKTVLVELKDGNRIVRKKSRDIPTGDEKSTTVKVGDNA